MACPSPSQSVLKAYKLQPLVCLLGMLAFRKVCLGVLPEIANFTETVFLESAFKGDLLT